MWYNFPEVLGSYLILVSSFLALVRVLSPVTLILEFAELRINTPNEFVELP